MAFSISLSKISGSANSCVIIVSGSMFEPLGMSAYSADMATAHMVYRWAQLF